MSLNAQNNLAIEQIRQKNLITNFLEQRNCLPAFIHHNRYLYKCPLPGHTETKPSFTVYDKVDAYQNFYCWGCGKTGDIISLYALLNNISWRRSLVELGGGLSISGQQELNYLVDKLKKEMERNKEEAKDLFDELSLDISNMGYSYLELVEYDKEEAEFLDKIYEKVDFLISSANIYELIEVKEFLAGENEYQCSPFKIRQAKWESKRWKKL
jgi:DNA primase